MRTLKKGILYTRNYQLGRRKNFFPKFSNTKTKQENGPRKRMPIYSRTSKSQSNYSGFKRKIPSLLADMVFDDREQNLNNITWKKAHRQPMPKDNYKERSPSRSFQDNLRKKEEIEVCRKWLKFGECMYGERCKYRHYSRHSDSEKVDYSGEPSTSRLSYDSERASIRSHKYGSSNKYLDVPNNFSHERNSSGSSNHNNHMRESPLVPHKSYISPKITNVKNSSKYISPTVEKARRSPSLAYTSDSEKSKKGSGEKRFKPSSVVVVVNRKNSKRHETRHQSRPIKADQKLIDQQQRNKAKSRGQLVPSSVLPNIHKREDKGISVPKSPYKKVCDEKNLKSHSVARSHNIPSQNLKPSVKPSTTTKTRTRLVSSIRTLARQNNFKKKNPLCPVKQPNTVGSRVKGRSKVYKQRSSISNGKLDAKRSIVLNVGDGKEDGPIITRCVLLPSKKKMQEAALHKSSKSTSISVENKVVKDKSPQKLVDPNNSQHKMSKSFKIPTPPSSDKAQTNKSIVKRTNDILEKLKTNPSSSENENKLISIINSKADDKLTPHTTSRPKDEEEIAASLEDLELKRQLLLFELQKEQLEELCPSPLTPSILEKPSINIPKSPVKDNTRFIPVTKEKIYLMQNLPEKKLSPISKPRTFVPRSVVKPSITQPKKGKIINKIESTRKLPEPQQLLVSSQTAKPSNVITDSVPQLAMPSKVPEQLNVKQSTTALKALSPLSETILIKNEEVSSLTMNQQEEEKSPNIASDAQETICVKPGKQLTKTGARSIAEAFFNESNVEEEEEKEYNDHCNLDKSAHGVGRSTTFNFGETKGIKSRKQQLRNNKALEEREEDDKPSLQLVQENMALANIKEIDKEEGEWQSSSSIYSSVSGSPNTEIRDISSQSSSDPSSLNGGEMAKKDADFEDVKDVFVVSPKKSPLTSSEYVVPRVVNTRPSRNKRDLEGECKLGGARPLDSDEDIEEIGLKTQPGTKKMPASTTIDRTEKIGFDIARSPLSFPTTPLREITPVVPSSCKESNLAENQCTADTTKVLATIVVGVGQAKVEDYENISSEESSCLDAEIEATTTTENPEAGIPNDDGNLSSQVPFDFFTRGCTQVIVHNENRDKLVSFLREVGVSKDLVKTNTYESIVKATGRPFKHDLAALHMRMVEREREDSTKCRARCTQDGIAEALKLLNPQSQLLTGKLDKALRDILTGTSEATIQPVGEKKDTSTPTSGIPKELMPPFLSSCSSRDRPIEAASLMFNRCLERFKVRFN